MGWLNKSDSESLTLRNESWSPRSWYSKHIVGASLEDAIGSYCDCQPWKNSRSYVVIINRFPSLLRFMGRDETESEIRHSPNRLCVPD